MGKKQDQSFWTRKHLILAVGGIVLVLSVGAAMMYWIVSNQGDASEGEAVQQEVEDAGTRARQAEADGQLQIEAAKQISSNNTSGADKIYEEAINQAAEQERKTQLFIDLSAVYYKEKRIDQAIATAKKAEAQNPDKFLVADWLSRIYEDQKNYKEAERYYRLAGESAGSPQNKTALNKAYFEAEADRVAKLGAAK